MNLRVAGIVLCGGESRRMGRPKAWLRVGNESMLERVVRIISEAARPIVVVAAPDQDVPPLPDFVTLVRDARKSRGPLEGLAAGLECVQSMGADAAYASSTDVPALRSGFVQRMLSLLGELSIAVPHIDDRHHPLAAVYRISVLPEIRRLLDADQLRPFFLFDRVPTRLVRRDELEEIDPGLFSLRNVNTPEDYEAVLREIA